MSKILDILEKEYPSEKSLILHRNFQVKFKDLLKSETLDLEKIQKGDVVAIIGDYDLRLRIMDLDGNYSEYAYYNNSIEVLNNIPYVTSLEVTSRVPEEEYPPYVLVSLDGIAFDDNGLTSCEWRYSN